VIPVSALIRFAIEELDVDVRPEMNRAEVIDELSPLIEGE